MTNDARATTHRRRLVLSILAILTVIIGLATHRGLPGAICDIAGDALYAILVYLLIALVVPRRTRAAVAVIAFAVCAGIELFQLTGLPREWASAFPPVGLVLGSGFDVRDVIVYAGAVTAAALVDHLIEHLADRVSAEDTSGNATGRPPEGERPV